MLIKKRVEGGTLQGNYSETIHEKETQEFRTYLQIKGYAPEKIIKEESEVTSQ